MMTPGGGGGTSNHEEASPFPRLPSPQPDKGSLSSNLSSRSSSLEERDSRSSEGFPVSIGGSSKPIAASAPSIADSKEGETPEPPQALAAQMLHRTPHPGEGGIFNGTVLMSDHFTEGFSGPNSMNRLSCIQQFPSANFLEKSSKLDHVRKLKEKRAKKTSEKNVVSITQSQNIEGHLGDFDMNKVLENLGEKIEDEKKQKTKKKPEKAKQKRKQLERSATDEEAPSAVADSQPSSKVSEKEEEKKSTGGADEKSAAPSDKGKKPAAKAAQDRAVVGGLNGSSFSVSDVFNSKVSVVEDGSIFEEADFQDDFDESPESHNFTTVTSRKTRGKKKTEEPTNRPVNTINSHRRIFPQRSRDGPSGNVDNFHWSQQRSTENGLWPDASGDEHPSGPPGGRLVGCTSVPLLYAGSRPSSAASHTTQSTFGRRYDDAASAISLDDVPRLDCSQMFPALSESSTPPSLSPESGMKFDGARHASGDSSSGGGIVLPLSSASVWSQKVKGSNGKACIPQPPPSGSPSTPPPTTCDSNNSAVIVNSDQGDSSAMPSPTGVDHQHAAADEGPAATLSPSLSAQVLPAAPVVSDASPVNPAICDQTSGSISDGVVDDYQQQLAPSYEGQPNYSGEECGQEPSQPTDNAIYSPVSEGDGNDAEGIEGEGSPFVFDTHADIHKVGWDSGIGVAQTWEEADLAQDDDRSQSGEFEFGFELNEDLLRNSLSSGVNHVVVDNGSLANPPLTACHGQERDDDGKDGQSLLKPSGTTSASMMGPRSPISSADTAILSFGESCRPDQAQMLPHQGHQFALLHKEAGMALNGPNHPGILTYIQQGKANLDSNCREQSGDGSVQATTSRMEPLSSVDRQEELDRDGDDPATMSPESGISSASPLSWQAVSPPGGTCGLLTLDQQENGFVDGSGVVGAENSNGDVVGADKANNRRKNRQPGSYPRSALPQDGSILQQVNTSLQNWSRDSSDYDDYDTDSINGGRRSSRGWSADAEPSDSRGGETAATLARKRIEVKQEEAAGSKPADDPNYQEILKYLIMSWVKAQNRNIKVYKD